MMLDTAPRPRNSQKANPVRAFSASDELYNEVKRIATQEDRSISATIRRALQEYVEAHGAQ